MKNLIIMLAIAALVSGLIQTTVSANLPTLALKSSSPAPAEPGDDLTIIITISNPTTFDMRDFEVSFEASNVFVLKSLKAGADISEGYTLCGNCKIENSYFFTVKPDAPSGIYPIYFRASKGGDSVFKKVDVEVKGKPNIVFDVASGRLDSLTPKSKFNLVLEVENIGTGTAREIKLSPDSTKFIPLGSSVKTIDLLPAKESKSVWFDFLVGENVDAESYNIPIKITYKDEKGANYTETQSVGVRVVNKGVINIQSIKVASQQGESVINSGVSMTVIVRLENVGEGDANFITAELECPFTSGKKSFIGKLEKDEDSPAVFDLVAGPPGAYDCNLTVAYEDDNGRSNIRENVTIEIAQSVDGGMAVIIIIILAIIGFVFRKRIKSFVRPDHRKK